ncbi:N-acetylglucosamine-6-phosphate deacetylase [Thalassospira sp.]|uniref:N-acetylglucosamine-6-phosphate deacetylase n=1 Tax=Thalassospira sp. TaxID=1912094 RepID=UPI000C5106B7|nr:N-acetylglucosamine-6-phosphate deacetylase [Thalassospira sp.]MBC08048.1 N-acetylglucosamine-6-phosphate deacetylase [Thalassospira sp.]|tara:strand:+ start:2297 stop:3445 length:1149 start_codon:yes stop_codon:yes gene_type:complete
MTRFAIFNARVFDGSDFYTDKAVVVRDGMIESLIAETEIRSGIDVIDAGNQILAPGLIDVQVNGGGGVLLNDAPDVESIKTIVNAHRGFGTTAMLPTLITDTREKMEAAIAAVQQALDEGFPGVVGLHLEGPYLNRERRGVHPADQIRPMEDDAIELLSGVRNGRTLVTLAPENMEPGAIAKLVSRGILVCAGHTAGRYEDIMTAIGEGMQGFTHLFNAMSPLTHREPGVVGAALSDDSTWCGLIADGFHVHPSVIKVAVRAKARGKMMLVTDAMPTVGAVDKRFKLGDEEIIAVDGRCALADGTLAGSDLDMISAVRNCVEMAEIGLDEALRMASLYPAEFLGLDHIIGRLVPGHQADMILFDDQFTVTQSWVKGARLTHV